MRAARVAAALGKRVGDRRGIPLRRHLRHPRLRAEEALVYASQFPEHFEDAAGYGWTVPEASFDWPTLVANKDREIAPAGGGSTRRASKGAGGETFHSPRRCWSTRIPCSIVGENRTVTADQILIATGGRPTRMPALPGHEHCIFSNEAFDLPELPKAILIAGGGYIAVEFANIFHGLGVETTLIYRGKEILARFDMDLRRMVCTRRWRRRASGSFASHVFERIEKRADGRLDAHLSAAARC